MGKGNVVHSGHEKQRRRDKVISGSYAYKYLNLADRTFYPAVKYGTLVPQMTKKISNRTEYHFVMAYLKEVKKILPKTRKKGVEIFTDEVRAQLAPLNKEWDGKLNVDWAQDARDTEAFMGKIGGIR